MRISTPPVCEASTKPSAATVLPAPVACSNQKRLAALGSSGCSPSDLLLVVLVDPVAWLLVRLGRRLLGRRLGVVVGGELLVLLVLVLVFVLVLVRGGAGHGAELVVLLVLVLLVELVRSSSSGSSSSSSAERRARLLGRGRWLVGPRMSAEASSSGEAEAATRPFGALRCDSASSAVSVPDSASTWCAESTVPSASFGSSSESRRSSPSSSENSRRHAVDGCFAFGSSASSASATSSARRRGVPGSERDGGVLAVVQEALAHELFGSRDVRGTWDGRGCEGH